MAFHVLSRRNGLNYEFTPPQDASGCTFVCFNPLSGDKAMWEAGIGPVLVERGHGLLCWNLRGQAGSLFTPGAITPEAIVEDAISLTGKIDPPNAVFTGHSIGGLFAAQAVQAGASCRAMVLINTLRMADNRLKWINDALVRIAEVGGLDLLRDVYSPLLMNEQWLGEHRSEFLKDEDYLPLKAGDGAYDLLAAGRDADWNFDWSGLEMPVLNITGGQDRIFRDPAIIARLAATMADVEMLDYEDCGHMIPAERPGRLAGDLLRFAERAVS
ncbi:MAG TPA: alpha/beta hydrolase [Rhizobiales bacterium]|nr:alpha/beta hydrolase [Hyphomicrobiales bacterium]